MANLHIQESRCAGISRIMWASQFAHACQPFMKSASLTRLDEYRLGSVDERIGIIISTPIKRMTRRDAGKVNLVIT